MFPVFPPRLLVGGPASPFLINDADVITLTITLLKNTSIQKPISQANKKDTEQLTVHAAPAVVQSNTDAVKSEKKAEPREITPVAKSAGQNKTSFAKKRETIIQLPLRRLMSRITQ